MIVKRKYINGLKSAIYDFKADISMIRQIIDSKREGFW